MRSGALPVPAPSSQAARPVPTVPAMQTPAPSQICLCVTQPTRNSEEAGNLSKRWTNPRQLPIVNNKCIWKKDLYFRNVSPEKVGAQQILFRIVLVNPLRKIIIRPEYIVKMHDNSGSKPWQHIHKNDRDIGV